MGNRSADWGVILYNQGEFDVDMNHYQLTGRSGAFYVITSTDVRETLIPSKGYWLVDGSTFSPPGPYGTSLLYFHPKSGTLALQDDQERILDTVVWNNLFFTGDFEDIPFFDKPDRDPFCLKEGSFYQGSVCP
jgi:hypothetical protein